MKKSYIIYSMIAIAAVMACNKVETNEQLAPTSEEKGYDVIYATAEATKTGLVGSGINEHIEWVKGDKVKIFNTSGTNKEYTAQSNGRAVAFAADDGSLTGMECALYPASCAIKRNTTRQIAAKLPAIQDGSFHNVIFGGVPATDPQQFIFTAVTSVIKINIPAEKNIIGLVVESDNAICGDFTADYQSGTKVWNTITTASTGKTITIQAEAGKILSGDIYVAVLPRTSSQNLTIKLFSSEKFGSKTNSVAHLNINTIEDFGTANIKFKDNKGFTIDAEGNQVFFAPGNLQYLASGNDGKGLWRFAENQWDFVGNELENAGNANGGGYISSGTVYVGDKKSTNTKIGNEGYDGWIDLFCFGTSGVNAKFPPTFHPKNDDEYQQLNIDLSIDTNYDWGKYCDISNANPNDKNWFTMSTDQWVYLFTRGGTTAAANPKWGPARVLIKDNPVATYVNGDLILPDYFIFPQGITFYSAKDLGTGSHQDFHKNTYSISEFKQIVSAGAVFLPCAGQRDNQAVTLSLNGFYSSTVKTEALVFNYPAGNTSIKGNKGRAVRLVRDVPAE